MADEQVPQPKASALDEALIEHGDELFKKLSRSRYVEELNWYESALMYAKFQWLKVIQ